MAKTDPDPTAGVDQGADVGAIPRGGMFERSVLLGGERLTDRFPEGEPFVLWGLEVVGDVPIEDGEKTVPKTVLTVSELGQAEPRFPVGTLSSAIHGYVEHAQPSDYPTVVCWRQVDTSRGLNPATVLEPLRGGYM